MEGPLKNFKCDQANKISSLLVPPVFNTTMLLFGSFHHNWTPPIAAIPFSSRDADSHIPPSTKTNQLGAFRGGSARFHTYNLSIFFSSTCSVLSCFLCLSISCHKNTGATVSQPIFPSTNSHGQYLREKKNPLTALWQWLEMERDWYLYQRNVTGHDDRLLERLHRATPSIYIHQKNASFSVTLSFMGNNLSRRIQSKELSDNIK